MILLPCKHASEPSPKLTNVAPGIHTNNGGHEMQFLHMVINPVHMDDPSQNMLPCEISKIWSYLRAIMVMFSYKQALESSPKLIVVATYQYQQ